MAFHQPTRQPLQRAIRPVVEDRDAPQTDIHRQASLDESHTWVVFSAATDTTSASYLSDVDESIPTPGRSRFSEIGSFARSQQGSRQSIALSSAIDDESVEDDAELDSLDSHLPDFRTFAGAYNQSSSGAAPHNTQVLPTHDGLGSFRIDNHVSHEIQDHLYAFERFNPRRTRRRRESLEYADQEAQQAEEQHAEKMQRIEAWRLEHSRILLDEIHKETRRRRQSQSSSRPRNLAEEQKTKDGSNQATVGSANMSWHDGPAADGEADEGVFARITRKVIRDIMGIDDRLLSMLLGDALPEDDDLSSTPTGPTGSATAMPPAGGDEESDWQLKILDRVARELGILVNQLTPQHHPGAFSTYTHMQQAPLPYAGLPAIPETYADAASQHLANDASAQLPEFKPTIPQQSQPMSIPAGRAPPEHSTQSTAGAFTQEEWEQDLDVKLVFRYLRNRFTSRSSSAPSFTSGTAHLATCSTQDTAAKAARVRQHHPLVARTRPPAERRQFKAAALPSPVAMRHASSCASQSTRRSARRSSVSSRHYWDIGGSMGTGSVIAPTGPMGSWGEV